MGDTPYRVALFRGIIGAVLSGGVLFFTTAPMSGMEAAFYSAGAAAFTYLAVRFAGEGTFDNRSGAQTATDVHRAHEDSPAPHTVEEDIIGDGKGAV